MRNKLALLPLIFGTLLMGVACKHQPLVVVDDDDTITPIDTTVVTEPCDPTIIYFDQQILPILISNCAKSGCHDAASAEDGVVLTSYATVMATGKIKPGDPGDSEVYEVITEDDEDKIMPPPPNAPLLSGQIQLIRDWIDQGAQRIVCEDEVCDSENMSYSADIVPILTNNCYGCHAGANPLGGFAITTYASVKAIVDNGSLSGSINWSGGYSPMPQGGAQLPQCSIDKIESWISSGAPNN